MTISGENNKKMISSEPIAIHHYKNWARMLAAISKHVANSGFNLVWWSDVDKLGFMCSQTNDVWVMDMSHLLKSESLVADGFKTEASKKNFLTSLRTLINSNASRNESKERCKVSECENQAKVLGFCGWCHNKFKKKLISSDGSKIRSIDEVKADIEAKFSMDKLKLYQVSYPDSMKSFGCPKLNFFVEEASCLRRIFIDKNKKECRKCKVHEAKFARLEQYLDDLTPLPDSEK